jgi:hypothetical protein
MTPNPKIRELIMSMGIIPESEHYEIAEQVIRECADAIIKDSRLNDVRSAANGCVRTINEYFGVEK